MLFLKLLVPADNVDRGNKTNDDLNDPDLIKGIDGDIAKAIEAAGISTGHYRLYVIPTISRNGMILEVCGAGCHPDLEKALEPLRERLEIVIFPDRVRYIPMKV
jgi:hypothetical protein